MYKVSASVGSVSHVPIILYVTDRNVQKIHHPRQELQAANKILAKIKKIFEYN